MYFVQSAISLSAGAGAGSGSNMPAAGDLYACISQGCRATRNKGELCYIKNRSATVRSIRCVYIPWARCRACRPGRGRADGGQPRRPSRRSTGDSANGG